MSSSTEVLCRRHSQAEPWTYQSLDVLQRQVAERVRLGKPGALLLNEVEPVITKGRRTPGTDIFYSESELRARGVSLYETDRGGLATYHGPGQWVVFPVDSLERLTGDRRGVRKAVSGLLELALSVATDCGVKAEIRWDAMTGVWTQHGKLASVGIHVEKGVLHHGLCLNVYKTDLSFVGLRPCGLDAEMDFLAKHSALSPEALMEKSRQALISKAFEIFWK